MNEELFCDFCGEELKGSRFLRWKVSCGDPVCEEQGEYEYCCLEQHDCLAAAAEADEMTDLDISCAGCGGGIFDGPSYLLLPGGLYVHDHGSCLAEYLVKHKKAQRSEEFYE